MASMSSETSYWIKFFTEAGIPAGDAAHYAIMFSDNRISKEMLLDLSKEYLTDMGITRLGDIIGILKHAKKVHNQEAKDLLLKSSSLTSLRSSSPSVNTPRRSTAASRMVNHFTSKHPEAGPMSQQPSPRPVSPDPPSSKRKVSVFDRLGAEGGDSDMTVSVPKTSSQQSGVFSRLGGKSGTKRAISTMSLNESEDKVDEKGSLPYVGLFKNTYSPSPNKKKKVEVIPTVQISNFKTKDLSIKKTIKSSDIGEITISNIQRPEVSTSTEGVLSAFAKRDTPTLKDRLGAKSEMPSSTTNITVKKSQAKKEKVSVQKRLGAKREEPSSSSSVVSSTQQINVKLKQAKETSIRSANKEVTLRSSNKDVTLRSAKQDAVKPVGVFSRLGKLSKV